MREARKTPALLAIAYHEAGHVVVAHHFGMAIAKKGVTIVPGEDYVGRATILHRLRNLEFTSSDAMRIKAERFAVMSMAGSESQRLHRPSSVRSYQHRSDYEHAVEIMSYFAGPDELSAYMKMLHIRARNTVACKPVWAMIERVAAALVEKQTLSRDEVIMVMKAATIPACTTPRVRRPRRDDDTRTVLV